MDKLNVDLFFNWRWWLIRKTWYYSGKSQCWYKKGFDSESVYNKEYLKKIKSHANEVTSFYDKKIPKVDSSHLCLAVISLVLLSRKITIIIHKSFKNVNILRKK